MIIMYYDFIYTNNDMYSTHLYTLFSAFHPIYYIVVDNEMCCPLRVAEMFFFL